MSSKDSVLIAPPQFLGKVRHNFSRELRECIVKEIPKDLAQTATGFELKERIIKQAYEVKQFDLPFDFFKDLINPFSISISTIESSISFALSIFITSQLLTGLHLKVDTKLPSVLPRHFLLDQ